LPTNSILNAKDIELYPETVSPFFHNIFHNFLNNKIFYIY